MAKYTSDDVRRVAERLRAAKDRSKTHFLLGAGCSISAGIPSAAELVKQIHEKYPEHCKHLSPDRRQVYGASMAVLTPNERRSLIKPYLDRAKISWGHIALAQLIAQDLVSRVLTVNFDLVLENACRLVGANPAVYELSNRFPVEGSPVLHHLQPGWPIHRRKRDDPPRQRLTYGLLVVFGCDVE
jgi:hypothetical protein